MLKYAILLMALPMLTLALEGIEPCQRVKAPLPYEVSNSKCEKNPCTINNGDTITAIDLFQVFNRTSSMRYRIDAWMGTFKIPLDFVPSDKRDGCKGLTSGECPASFGDYCEHKIDLPVEAPYNDVTIHMEAQMIDEKNLPIYCYRTTVTVLPPKTDA